MKLHFVLASLASLLLPSHVEAASSKLSSFCLTYYGSTSTSSVTSKTTSATTTSVRTITTTSTPKTTITPASATTTKTATSTAKTTVTLSKSTDTYTSTTTFSSTSTVTSTIVDTATSTVVVTTTDTRPATVSPSPDFTPLAAELSPGGYSVGACPTSSSAGATALKRGERDIFARDPNAVAALLPRATSSSSATSYPAEVDCTTLYYATSTSTVTSTASTTVTKSLNQGTITSTTTVTTTSTSTKVPSTVQLTVTSTTTTVTSTATASSVTTTSTTTTTTAYQPASTVYAACQADNIVQCVNGYQVSNPHFTYNIMSISGPTDAASCCVACSMQQNCGGSFFYQGYSLCYGVISDMCEGNNTYSSFQVQPGSYAPYVFSNSNCGRWSVRAPDS